MRLEIQSKVLEKATSKTFPLVCVGLSTIQERCKSKIMSQIREETLEEAESTGQLILGQLKSPRTKPGMSEGNKIQK